MFSDMHEEELRIAVETTRKETTQEIFSDILNEQNIETVYFTFDGNIRERKVITLETIMTIAKERGVKVRDIKYGK